MIQHDGDSLSILLDCYEWIKTCVCVWDIYFMTVGEMVSGMKVVCASSMPHRSSEYHHPFGKGR